MNDMSAVIVPKSDQLNADSLLSGPITITISEVAIRPGTEQPVSIHYTGDNGKPYKPCKSMARVMVHCWGPDASKYTGRSMTLYCDPKVKWGGMAVGGIRISAMTDIADTVVMALTETKGNKKPFVVKPLVREASKKGSLSDWMAAVGADLAAAQTANAVAGIEARDDVQKALVALKPEPLARLKAMIADATARTADATPADNEPDGEYGHPAAEGVS